MNIFGVGGAELMVIIMIMLIVAGPKRMIRWAFVIGQYIGKFRILWAQMVDVMQDEVDAAGLDVQLPREIPTKENLTQTAGALMKPYIDPIEKTLEEAAQPLKDTLDETNKVARETKKELDVSANLNRMIEKADKSKASKAVTPKDDNTSEGFGAWSKPKSSEQEIEA